MEPVARNLARKCSKHGPGVLMALLDSQAPRSVCAFMPNSANSRSILVPRLNIVRAESVEDKVRRQVSSRVEEEFQ